MKYIHELILYIVIGLGSAQMAPIILFDILDCPRTTGIFIAIFTIIVCITLFSCFKCICNFRKETPQ